MYDAFCGAGRPLSFAQWPFCSAKPAVVDRYLHMNINGNLYVVYRKKEVYPECGYNEVLVCAKDENQAKGIAMNSCELRRTYLEESKKDILVRKIEQVNIGDVLLKG